MRLTWLDTPLSVYADSLSPGQVATSTTGDLIIACDPRDFKDATNPLGAALMRVPITGGCAPYLWRPTPEDKVLLIRSALTFTIDPVDDR